MYVLDSNILAYFITGKSKNLFNKLTEIDTGKLKITIINYAEFQEYIDSKDSRTNKFRLYQNFLDEFEILEFTKDAAKVFARLRKDLRKIGNTINDLDLMIAAICITNKAILVTHNLKHFKRIKGLKAEDWY